MEGRILRSQADPQTQPQIAGPGGRATTIRRLVGTTVAIIAAAFLVSTLMLATASVADIGVASAEAAKCKWANAGPRRVSRKHARHAVVCQINKRRRSHGLKARQGEALAPQGGEAALQVHAAPRLLRASVPWGEGPRGEDPRHELSPLQLQLARG